MKRPKFRNGQVVYCKSYCCYYRIITVISDPVHQYLYAGKCLTGWRVDTNRYKHDVLSQNSLRGLQPGEWLRLLLNRL